MAAFSRMTGGSWTRLGLSLAAFLFGAWAAERNAVWRSEVAVWEDALTKAPGKARVRGNLGVAYFYRGKTWVDLERRDADWDKAEAYFKAAVAVDPRFTEIWANLGNMYHARGRMDEAEAALDRAIKFKPNRGEFHGNLGGVYLEKGWTSEAIVEFEAAARLSPHPSRAYSNLGVALADLKRYPEAVRALEHALELEPGYLDARVNLGLAYENVDRIDEAERVFEEVCATMPDHVGAILNLAHLRWSKRGDTAGALSLARRAIGLMHEGDPRLSDAQEFVRSLEAGGGERK